MHERFFQALILWFVALIYLRGSLGLTGPAGLVVWLVTMGVLLGVPLYLVLESLRALTN
jgi:hypothetical protein